MKDEPETAVDAEGGVYVGGTRIGELKSDQEDSTEGQNFDPAVTVYGANPSLLMYQTPRGRQGPGAWLPLRRPDDDAHPAVWAAYRAEKQRRKVIKRERRGRIARRETPHDTTACVFCKSVSKRDESDRSVAEIAKRSLVSPSTVYRVLQQSYGKGKVRGHRTLRTLRRIAHDGMGISLDELAATILD